MLTLEHNGYYTLTKNNIEKIVPSQPGIYLLAVQLSNGVHQTILTRSSDNLYLSLRRILEKDGVYTSIVIQECVDKYQCYFTY